MSWFKTKEQDPIEDFKELEKHSLKFIEDINIFLLRADNTTEENIFLIEFKEDLSLYIDLTNKLNEPVSLDSSDEERATNRLKKLEYVKRMTQLIHKLHSEHGSKMAEYFNKFKSEYENKSSS